MVRSAMLYGTECWTIKKHVHKINVVEMKILSWISGNTRKAKITTEEICLEIAVTPQWERMIWFKLKE